jgi:hypothetical protein
MQALPHLPGGRTDLFSFVMWEVWNYFLFMNIHDFLIKSVLTWVFTPREQEALDLSRDRTMRKTNSDNFRHRQTGQEQPA